MKKIKSLTWSETFQFWHDNEGKSDKWLEVAKRRGFSSWADWRLEAYARPLGCEDASWGLYEIKNPAKAVTDFYGGPFPTWIKKYYEGEKTKTFANLVKIKELREGKGIQELKSNFPQKSIIICLRSAGKIYVIEGMHRSCALALMSEEKNYSVEKMHFAIGELKVDELPAIRHGV